MESEKIVIIEDEQEISELIQSQIVNLGFTNVAFYDGKKALDYIQSDDSRNIQLFILDRMLPSVNGLEICKFIRIYNSTKDTPILMLTALSTPEQIVEGLDAGADDYMTKPFDHAILVARVKSLLRRRQASNRTLENKNVLRHKNLVVDMDQCKTWIDDQILELTLSEYKILCCFLLSPGKVLTRNQLVEYIQDGPVHVTDRTIDTHIFGLRKKLGDYASIIETIRGIGYRVINHD
ncbi:MAG: DNA-binding response regulator [Alphaproteobacteria bacterium]|nr:MAG: DNA-binding response regulator [Alphaproteobacteria bacterium]